MTDLPEAGMGVSSMEPRDGPSRPTAGMATSMPLPSRPSAGVTPGAQDAPAWTLAFLPLATSLFYILAMLANVNVGVVSLATVVGSAALVVLDRRDLVRTGRLPHSRLPSMTWFLFPPTYLFKRARRLDAPRNLFWTSVGCLVLAFIVRAAVVTAMAVGVAKAGADPILPGCADRESMPDVVSVFDNVEDVRDAGLHGVIVTGQTEIARGPGAVPTKMFCSGRIRASNNEEYEIQYAFEIVQGQVLVHVQVQ